MVSLADTLQLAASVGSNPTLAELGGSDVIEAQAQPLLSGPYFSLLVSALVDAGVAGHEKSVDLLIDGFTECDDPATFGAAVAALPEAAGRLADQLVEVLLRRAGGVTDPRSSHIAGRALVGATHVALNSGRAAPPTRVALGLSTIPSNCPAYVALAATRVAGALADARPEEAALLEEVDRLLQKLSEHPDVDLDVAIEHAYRDLTEALAGESREEVDQGLRATAQAFHSVVEADSERIDAAIVASGLDGVLAFVDGVDPSAAARRLDDLCDERAMYATSSGDAVSRYASEAGWRALAWRLKNVQSYLDDERWLNALEAIDAFIDAVQLSRSFRSEALELSMVISPRLSAPFVTESHHRALLERYVDEIVKDESRRDAAKAIIAASDLHPKPAGSEPSPALLGALDSAGVTEDERRAIQRQLAVIAAQPIDRTTQWYAAYISLTRALFGHSDARAPAGINAKRMIWHLLDFVGDRLDQTRGRRDHLSYLKEPNALEQRLADDLAAFLRTPFGPRVRTEISDVGGGRVDVLVEYGDDRIVIECKRDRDPWTSGTLEGWAAQADQYLGTGTRIGFLVLLDLADKSSGARRDLAGSVQTIVLSHDPIDHLVFCFVVPGNQSTPSSVGATSRAAQRRASRSHS